MNDSGRTYYENRVLTASPAKLQWMLIDGALKAVRLAEQLLVAGETIRASDELAQAEAILSEIIGSMRKELSPAVVTKSAAVYAFIVRRLTEAHLSGEVQPVRDAARVLEVELETWRLVCEQSDVHAASPPSHHFAAPTAAPVAAPIAMHTDDYQGGFSLEA